VAARQPSNELVADILSRAADPEIRQAGLRDAAKLLRAVIGIDVPLDDLSGAATIDESLRQTQRKSDEAGAKLRQLEREGCGAGNAEGRFGRRHRNDRAWYRGREGEDRAPDSSDD